MKTLSFVVVVVALAAAAGCCCPGGPTIPSAALRDRAPEPAVPAWQAAAQAH